MVLLLLIHICQIYNYMVDSENLWPDQNLDPRDVQVASST